MDDYTDNYVEYTQMSELLTTVKDYVDDHSDGNANLQKVTYEEATALKAHAVGDFIYLNDTVYKVTSAISIGDTITVGTNITATTGLPTDTQIYVDGLPDSGGGGGASIGETHTVTGNQLSFTTDSSQVSSNTVVTLEPIQAGSGDPSPSNVRDIYGYANIDISISDEYLDGYTVEHGGVGGTDTSITKNDSTNRVKVYWIPVSNGDIITPYITCNVSVQISGSVWGTNEFGTNTLLQSISWTNNGKAINITNSGYLIILIRKADNSTISPSEVEIEISKPTNSITIPAPDGTIYGGTLDVESGELVVDRKKVFISDFNWVIDTATGQQGNQRLKTYQVVSDIKIPSSTSETPKLVCSCFIGESAVDAWSGYGGIAILRSGEIGVYPVQGTTYASASEFTTALGNQTIVYPLATPKTYHLSPHQVKLLTGANTVTTNGTSLSLTYRDGEIPSLSDLEGIADSINDVGDLVDTAVKEGEVSIIQKINDNIAPTEFTNIASKAYSVGEYFINKDGKLCRVISAIASGATITVGTNCVVQNISLRLRNIFTIVSASSNQGNTFANSFILTIPSFPGNTIYEMFFYSTNWNDSDCIIFPYHSMQFNHEIAYSHNGSSKLIKFSNFNLSNGAITVTITSTDKIVFSNLFMI